MMVREKLELLSKTCWSISDIAKYFEVGKNTAGKIRMAAIKKGGLDPFNNYGCKVDSILLVEGTTLSCEIDKLERINKLCQN